MMVSWSARSMSESSLVSSVRSTNGISLSLSSFNTPLVAALLAASAVSVPTSQLKDSSLRYLCSPMTTSGASVVLG